MGAHHTVSMVINHPNWNKREKMAKLAELCRTHLRSARTGRDTVKWLDGLGLCEAAGEQEQMVLESVKRADVYRAGIRDLFTLVSGSYDWSGSPDPEHPDKFWIDDETGERVCATCGHREPR